MHPPPAGKHWSLARSLGVLAAAVVGTGVASELLVHAVEPVSKSLGLSQFFVGLVVIPIVGNVSEHYGAITFARRNQMDLSISIAANSSTQIAVFVAPFLVLASLLFHPMDLIFQPIELVTLFASTAIFAYVSLDGETNWLEGVQLLALYLIAVGVLLLPSRRLSRGRRRPDDRSEGGHLVREDAVDSDAGELPQAAGVVDRPGDHGPELAPLAPLHAPADVPAKARPEPLAEAEAHVGGARAGSPAPGRRAARSPR